MLELEKKAEKLQKVVEEQKLVTEIQEKLQSNEKYGSDKQNYINLAYYCGKQWIAWDTTSRKLYQPPTNPGKTYYVGNRIQPIIRTELSKVLKNKPIMEVMPSSNDDSDILAAKVGDKVVQFLEYSLDMQQKDEDLVMWALTTDISFLKVFWNPNKGDTIVDPDTGEKIKLGDVDVDVVNSFECTYDRSAKKWDDVGWFCHRKTRTIDYVQEMYGKDVEAEDNIADSNVFENQVQNLSTTLQNSAYSKSKNSVVVKEYWEKPSAKYPKGRRITIANGVLLFYAEDIGFSEKDESERELPFFPMWHIDIPGRVGGQSVIEQLIPVQREYNRSRSQIIDNKNLMANPKWISESGSLVDDIDDTAQVIEYYKGFNAPHRDQPPSMGSDIYKNLEQIENEFYVISGMNEMSTPHLNDKNNLSGVALSILEEQDYTKIAPTVNKYVRCKQAYMSYMLRMVKFKYDIPRTIKIVGKNKDVEIMEFEGSQLTSTDVRIQEGTMLQSSKASKQQWIMNLIVNRVLDPVKDRDTILKMLELGIVDELWDNQNIDHDQALAEELKWSKGDTSPIVRDFYNHQIHIFDHNRFRKQNEYENMGPDMQQVIDNHIMEHTQFLQSGQDPKAFLAGLDEQSRQAILNSPNPEQALTEAMLKGGQGNGQQTTGNMS